MRIKPVVVILIAFVFMLVVPISIVTVWSTSSTSKLEKELLELKKEIAELKGSTGKNLKPNHEDYLGQLNKTYDKIFSEATKLRISLNKECLENEKGFRDGVVENAVDQGLKEIKETSCESLNTANIGVVSGMLFATKVNKDITSISISFNESLRKVTGNITELRGSVEIFLFVLSIALSIFSFAILIFSISSVMEEFSDLTDNNELRESLKKVSVFFKK